MTNILQNIVSPTKHCHGSDLCYGLKCHRGKKKKNHALMISKMSNPRYRYRNAVGTSLWIHVREGKMGATESKSSLLYRCMKAAKKWPNYQLFSPPSPSCFYRAPKPKPLPIKIYFWPRQYISLYSKSAPECALWP